MNNISASSSSASKVLYNAALLIALAAVGYHATTIWITLNGAMEHYTLHIALMLLLTVVAQVLVYLRQPANRGRSWRVILVAMFGVCAAVATPYLYVMAQALELSQPFLQPHEVIIGTLLVAAVLGLTWVVWGAALGVVCVAAALYFAFGHLVPSLSVGMPLSPEVVVSYMAGMGGPRGVYTFVPLSADTLFLLLVYGGLMRATLVLDMFAELGKSVGNLFRGGVAFSSITASTCVGMVTGQTVSTIALTGSINIPTMTNRGFTREQAGAIEVLAANGSQIIPPVMGLGAFLMAVIIGVPYTDIATAAVLPAILYMGSIAIGVYAMIQGSPSIPYTREKVNWHRVLWTLPAFLTSFTVLVVMLFMQFTAGFAAVWGIAILLGASLIRPKEYRPAFPALLGGFRDGALAGAHLAVILAGIGIIVQMLSTTGLGIGLSQVMIDLSASSLEIGLLVGMAIALLIGMGLPTPAAYSLAAIIVIPTLIDVGLEPLVAHFYGFYFAVFSSLTPPVAVGILMASKISGGSFRKTVIEAFKLGGLGMLLPLFFVMFPDVLAFPELSLETVLACLLFLLSTLMLAGAMYGALRDRLSISERIALGLGPVGTVLYYDTKDALFAAVPIGIYLAVVILRMRTQAQRGMSSGSQQATPRNL